MAEDATLNGRIRAILQGAPSIEERRMFGGRCFLHDGHMLCGCDQKYGLSVRVGPDRSPAVLRLKHAREMNITGRPMKGLVFVEAAGYRTKAALKRWIDRGHAYTSTLPPKPRTRRTPR